MSKRQMLQMALGRGYRNMVNPLLVPKATIFSSRLGMTNKYAYDYACEDEYFEREMTMLDAKLMSLPLPNDFKHKTLPLNEIFPSHINDVRFNFLPQNLDRRCFLHDNMAIFYNQNEDYHHGIGYEDEDLDYEMPDPFSDMHMKYKRSTVMNWLIGFVACGVVIFYPAFGLKMPQKDNPFFFRKKYGTTSTIQQFQHLAMVEYGGKVDKWPDPNVIWTHKGFDWVGAGLRMDLPSYGDLIC